MSFKKLFFFSSIIYSTFIFSTYHVSYLKNFHIISLDTLLKKHSDTIGYIQFNDVQRFSYTPLEFSKFPKYQPHEGSFDKTWVLTIPSGRVCSGFGYVVIDEKFMIRELIDQISWFVYNTNIINEISFSNVRRVAGRVAVIAGRYTNNYAHFLSQIIGRLAILETMGIEYDWLYVPYDKVHIKEILQAWGIDPLKIICPEGEFFYIEADELIVPSFTARIKATPHITFFDQHDLCGTYWPAWLTDYLRYKFLPLVKNKPIQYGKKIFISRKDGSGRQILNEDEVFKLLEEEGFERYELSTLSFLDQVALFHNAEIVIGEHGTGLVNILFCKPNTKVIELFQARSDTSFTYLAETLKLDYTAIKTMELLDNRMGGTNTAISLDIIKNVIKTLHN